MAKMMFVGQETVRKQQRHLKYTVYMRFNQFIEIMITDSHTNPRGTQREYSSKTLKHSIVKRILVFKR